MNETRHSLLLRAWLHRQSVPAADLEDLSQESCVVKQLPCFTACWTW
jgi:hypothetical protein